MSLSPIGRTRALIAGIAALALLGVAVAAPRSAPAPHTVYLPVARGRSVVNVTGSLQAAVDAATPGDVLLLGAQTYAGAVLRHAGSAALPITIRGAGVGATVIQGTLRVAGTAAFWNIEDLDVQGTTGDGVKIDGPAHDVAVARAHIYGGAGYGVRVGTGAANVLVENSEIDHFGTGTGDAHGVGIMTASHVTVRGCDIHHNQGDAVQSNTPDFPGYGRFASDIVIEGNSLHENRENAIDIKSTHGLTASHNLAWGYRPVSTSDGMAIQVQYDAQDIRIIGNQVWDSVEGLEVSQGTKNGVVYPAAPARVLIAGNVFHDIVSVPGGDTADGSGVVVRSSDRVRIYNNTMLRVATAGLYVSLTNPEPPPTNLDVRNNVLDGAVNDLYIGFSPATLVGAVFGSNHYVNSKIDNGSLAGWLALGLDQSATSGDPKLDTSLLPLAGSPLHDSGASVGLPFTGAAPDRGWGEL